jgi:hypothetical protein
MLLPMAGIARHARSSCSRRPPNGQDRVTEFIPTILKRLAARYTQPLGDPEIMRCHPSSAAIWFSSVRSWRGRVIDLLRGYQLPLPRDPRLRPPAAPAVHSSHGSPDGGFDRLEPVCESALDSGSGTLPSSRVGYCPAGLPGRPNCRCFSPPQRLDIAGLADRRSQKSLSNGVSQIGRLERLLD